MLRIVLLILTTALLATSCSASAGEPAKEGETLVYELRTYT